MKNAILKWSILTILSTILFYFMFYYGEFHFKVFYLIALSIIAIVISKGRYTFSAINGFYIGTLAFVLFPAIYFYNAAAGLMWTYTYIPKMQVSISEIESAVDIILLGLFLTTTTATFPRTSIVSTENLSNKKIGTNFYKTGSITSITAIYVFSAIVLIYKTIIVGGNQYGDTPLDIIYAFANSVCSISALMLISKSRKTAFKFALTLLFAPSIFYGVVSLNRGTFLTIVLLVLVTTLKLRLKGLRLVAIFIAGYFVTSYVSYELADYRTEGRAKQLIGDNYLTSLASESIMVPTMGLVIRELKLGHVDFQNGTDLVLIPAYFIPRALWPSKPLPLDYRLNRQIGLNTGTPFGTPITIYGGLYINGGYYGYVILMLILGLFIRKLTDTQDLVTSVLFFTYFIDLVRVGDIARETVTVSIWLISYKLLSTHYVLDRFQAKRAAGELKW